jgi:hypothetical protein
MEPLLKYIIYFLLGIICYYLLKDDLIEGIKCNFTGATDRIIRNIDECTCDEGEVGSDGESCHFGDTCIEGICTPLSLCNFEGSPNVNNCKCIEPDTQLTTLDADKICISDSSFCERTEVNLPADTGADAADASSDTAVSYIYECKEFNDCINNEITTNICKCFLDTDKTTGQLCKPNQICNASGCMGNYCPITREGEGEDAHAIHTGILSESCYCNIDSETLCGGDVAGADKNQICNKLRECKDLLECDQNTLINEPCKCNDTICKINEICSDDSTAPRGTCKEIPSCDLSTDDLEKPLVNKCFCEGNLCSPPEDQSEKIYCNESKGCYKKQLQIYQDCVVNETNLVTDDCTYTKDDIQSVCQKGKMYNASGCWSRKPILRIESAPTSAPAPVYDQPGPFDDLFDQIKKFFEDLFK